MRERPTAVRLNTRTRGDCASWDGPTSESTLVGALVGVLLAEGRLWMSLVACFRVHLSTCFSECASAEVPSASCRRRPSDSAAAGLYSIPKQLGLGCNKTGQHLCFGFKQTLRINHKTEPPQHLAAAPLGDGHHGVAVVHSEPVP
jgi:hypothetical protein